MTSKKHDRASLKASKTVRRPAEGSRKKLAEAFLADLDRSWQQHGRETLDRVRTERPQVYFRMLVKLTVALHRVLGKLDDVDRRRNRDEVLLRLEQCAR
jgi:hypothetical protein